MFDTGGHVYFVNTKYARVCIFDQGNRFGALINVSWTRKLVPGGDKYLLSGN